MNEETFKEQAKKTLAQCKIIDNKDGTIDVIGNLTVKFPLKYLPKIKNLIGYLDCRNNNYLTNLINAPETITLDLRCNNCDSLKTLEGAPKSVRNFYCFDSKSLETLKGAPQTVNDCFNCSQCHKLKTLEGAPKTVKTDFSCYNCTSLETLKDAPQTVGGYFNCSECYALKTLEGAPQNVGETFNCSNCNLIKTLEGAPSSINCTIVCDNCKDLPPDAKDKWFKKQASHKKRVQIETSLINQAEATWKHSI